jgi:hypothetical protein
MAECATPLPTLTGSVTFVIDPPYSTIQRSVTLPQPMLGNTIRPDLKSIQSKNINDVFQSYKPTEWLNEKLTLVLTFSLTTSVMTSFKNYILDFIGSPILFTDWYGVQYNCVITDRSPRTQESMCQENITVTMTIWPVEA